MRSATQIDKGIMLVDGDFNLILKRVAILIKPALIQTFDQLQFIGLILEDSGVPPSPRLLFSQMHGYRR